ncbi:MAG: GspH/FimT family pseudopilin [Chromatiales bacterium]
MFMTGVVSMKAGSDYDARRNGGVTTIELLVALSVLAILLTVAVPSFQNFIADNRLTAETNNLVADLQYARSEAIKRRIPVTACASADLIVCAETPHWENGWMIFTDVSGTAGERDGADELLRVHQPAHGDITIEADRIVVRYLPTGGFE